MKAKVFSRALPFFAFGKVRFVGVTSVWQRNFLYFRYNLWISLLWIWVEPALYFLAIGYGLGGFIGEVRGTPYAEFYFPGLMAASGMMVSFFEATYNSFARLRHETFSTILLAPVLPSEIAFGEILWAASKGFISVLGVALIAALQGFTPGAVLVPLLAVAFLMCWAFAAFGLLLTTHAKAFDIFVYAHAAFIIPMYLFSGTFFPVESLPPYAQTLTYFLPLTHGISFLRTVLSGEANAFDLIHLFVVAIFAWGCTFFAAARLEKKLIT